MLFDVVSDLHVDFWSEHPYNWKANKVADVVIVAGDIADCVDVSVRELKEACNVYETVLYVSGNHEASNYYHDLSVVDAYIAEKMKDTPNFHLLSETDVVMDNVVIIGATGWGDFKICEPEFMAEDCKKLFNSDWCPDKTLETEAIVDNIVRAAHSDYESIKEKIRKYRDNYFICVVTHTVPHKDLLSKSYPLDQRFAGYYGNSMFKAFFDETAVRCFVYGHNHDNIGVSMLHEKLCVNNARGRPSDYNRVDYKPVVIDLH